MREFVRPQEETSAHQAWLQRQVQMELDSANTGDLLSSYEVGDQVHILRILHSARQ